MKAPYFAVIFTSKRSLLDEAGYETAATRMVELARQQKGFLGVESARAEDGVGITVSYWDSTEAIASWKNEAEHTAARSSGRKHWYSNFTVRICKVEREYSFDAEP